MAPYETMTTENLHEQFTSHARDIERGGNPRHIYYKCNSMRKIWLELEKRKELPHWPDDDVMSQAFRSL